VVRTVSLSIQGGQGGQSLDTGWSGRSASRYRVVREVSLSIQGGQGGPPLDTGWSGRPVSRYREVSLSIQDGRGGQSLDTGWSGLTVSRYRVVRAFSLSIKGGQGVQSLDTGWEGRPLGVHPTATGRYAGAKGWSFSRYILNFLIYEENLIFFLSVWTEVVSHSRGRIRRYRGRGSSWRTKFVALEDISNI
jgi:hypothetical protein